MKNFNIHKITFSGMFAALFFMSGNILPPIQVIPGVPITMQNLVVALAAAVLGFGGGMLTLLTIFFLTAVGVPMMSGFSGGLSVFWKPTTGYMLGWLLLCAAVGLYRSRFSPKILKLSKGRIIDFILFLIIGNLGIFAQYLCGAVFLSIYNGTPEAVFSLFLSSAAVFGIFDAAKIATAYILAASIARVFPTLGELTVQEPRPVKGS